MSAREEGRGRGRFLFGFLTGFVLALVLLVILVTFSVGAAFYFVTPGMVVDAMGVDRAAVEQYVDRDFLDETRLSGLTAQRFGRALDKQRLCEQYAGVGADGDPEGIEQCVDRLDEMFREFD